MMANGPLLISLNSAASTLDGAGVGRKTVADNSVGSHLVQQLVQYGLGHEAQMMHDAWIKFRAVLDQAIARATTLKL